MAKDEFDLDMDFPDDGFGFDDDFDAKPLPKPKNKREAIMRAGGDLAYGFGTGLLENPAQDAKNLAYESIPKKVKRDADILLGAKSDLTDHIAKSMDEIKQEGGRQLKSIAKHFDKEGMFGKMFGKIADKLGVSLDDEQRGPSEAQIEAEQTRAFIAEALGEMKSIEQANAEVQQKLQEKQNATTAEILQNVYAENSAIREFHFTVANAYYRKSLELQYKQALLANKQYQLHVEDSKIYRAQLEAIVRNTGLPDYLKLTSAERIKEEFKRRVADDVVSTFYNKDNNIMNNLIKGAKRKVDEFKSGFIEKMQAGGEFATGLLEAKAEMDNQIEEMQENGIRMSKATMVGGELAGWLKNKVTGRIGRAFGDRLSKTDSGKYFMDIVKGAANDPVAALRELSESNDPRIKESGIGKALQKLAGMTADLANTASTDRVEFDDIAMDEAALFDGRAHTALTKIIPGFLSKIHAEIKSIRTKTNPMGNELTYDTRSGTFKTAKRMVKEFKAESKEKLQTTFMPSIEELLAVYANCTGKDEFKTYFPYKEQLGRALMEYYLKNSSGSTEPSLLMKDDLLDKIENDEIREDFANAGKIVVAMAQNFARTRGENNSGYDNIGDVIRAALFRIKTEGIPFLKGRMEEMYRMGGGARSALIGAGVVSKDKFGRISFDQGRLKNQTMKWNKEMFSEYYAKNDLYYTDERAKDITAWDGKNYNILKFDSLNITSDLKTTAEGVWEECKGDVKKFWEKIKKGAKTIKDAEKRKELFDKYKEKIKDSLYGVAGVTDKEREDIVAYIKGNDELRRLQGYDPSSPEMYKAAAIANVLGKEALINEKVQECIFRSQEEWNKAMQTNVVKLFGLGKDLAGNALSKANKLTLGALLTLKGKKEDIKEFIGKAAKDAGERAKRYASKGSELVGKTADQAQSLEQRMYGKTNELLNTGAGQKLLDAYRKVREGGLANAAGDLSKLGAEKAVVEMANVVTRTVIKDAEGRQREIIEETKIAVSEDIATAMQDANISVAQIASTIANERDIEITDLMKVIEKELTERAAGKSSEVQA